jgi:gamma-glutamyltranspeptidase
MSETPTFAFAAVAAPHSLAAETGQSILAQGGNAVEAMIAMAATVAVVYPHMNGIGGDGFWLVREPGGRVHAIEACGPAGSLATQKRYRDKGYDDVPPRGPDAALTVAGAVAGWQLALELAKARGGQLPLDVLLADALRLAREGCPVSRSEARYVVKEREAVHAAPGFAAAFLAEGKTPEAGALRRQTALAGTLEQLAHAGLADFYRGDVGREIAADLERIGAPIARRDLETFRARVVEPLSLRHGDATLYNFPPPTQGLASLVLLGIFERLKVARGETVEHHHGLVEATKRAFAIRDRVVTDPAHLTDDPSAFLTRAFL